MFDTLEYLWYIRWDGLFIIDYCTQLTNQKEYCMTVLVMYIDNSNDSYRDISTADVLIVVLLVVLHIGHTNHNHPKIQVNKYLSIKCQRVRCTLAVSTKWVDHSGVTNAYFGHCTCSGLWLLSVKHGNLGLLSAVPNLATTICFANLDMIRIKCYGKRAVQHTSPNLSFAKGNGIILWNKIMKEVRWGRYADSFKTFHSNISHKLLLSWCQRIRWRVSD